MHFSFEGFIFQKKFTCYNLKLWEMLVLILVSVRLSFKAPHNYLAMCHDHEIMRTLEIYHKAISYKMEVGVCLDTCLQV